MLCPVSSQISAANDAGDGWGEIAVPLIQAYPGSAIIFMGSSLTLVFGVLNLIVAVEARLHFESIMVRAGPCKGQGGAFLPRLKDMGWPWLEKTENCANMCKL